MPTTAESSASQVEAETSHPRRRLGRPRGARNLLTIEERQHNKKVLAKAYYERTKEYKKMQRRLSEEKKSNGQVNSMEEGPGGRAGQASTIEEKETNRVDGPSHSQGSYNGHSLDRTLGSPTSATTSLKEYWSSHIPAISFSYTTLEHMPRSKAS